MQDRTDVSQAISQVVDGGYLTIRLTWVKGDDKTSMEYSSHLTSEVMVLEVDHDTPTIDDWFKEMVEQAAGEEGKLNPIAVNSIQWHIDHLDDLLDYMESSDEVKEAYVELTLESGEETFSGLQVHMSYGVGRVFKESAILVGSELLGIYAYRV